jgi:hypothetical protein
MHDTFYGYYAPSQEEYQKLWNDALISVDTNVLLSLYRLPKTAREEFLSVLSDLKARIWIPYHVALEFQRNRLAVIANERRTTEAALQASGELIEHVKAKVGELQIDKHDLGFESQALIGDLEGANAKLVEAIQAVHAAQLEITANDPIRERIDELVGQNVGAPAKSKEELEALIVGGEARYDARIPPGFADAEKDKNPANATFIHDSLTYQRKFGDLIVWRQLLAHCKKAKLKTVLFVTSDKKEDWWWREQGKTMGPHPELVREIKRESGVELFWMYSSAQFLEHAKKYKQANVSEQSVAEVQDAVRNHLRSYTILRESRPALADAWGPRYTRESLRDARHGSAHELRIAESSVQNWLEDNHGGEIISQVDTFPDLIAVKEDEIHGYEVKFTRTPARFFQSVGAMGALSRGYVELKEGRLFEFYLVVVIPRDVLFQFVEDFGTSFIDVRIANTLAEFPITGIIVGTVREDGSFEPFTQQTE